MISDFYLENLTRFPDTNVLAIADIDLDRAKAAAEKWNVPSAEATEDLLADPDIEIVLNLTIPAAHASVSTTALEAGKHVWSEKPITVDRDDELPMARAGLVSPQSGVLVRPRRRTGLRHGTVFLLSAGPLVGSDRQGRCYRPYRNDQAPDPRRTSGGHRVPGGGAHTRLGSHRIRAGWRSADS